ncbi:MAG TPA: iron-containing redox enzyme family protein [Phenylobacterium sp.]
MSQFPLESLATALAEASGPSPPAAFDGRIDVVGDDLSLMTFVKHQALMRCYQARYVLLPEQAPAGGVLAAMQRHYGAPRLAALSDLRADLEAELITPLVPVGAGDVARYTEAILSEIREAPENAFTVFLAGAQHQADHYRNFLVQSSPDLLAEASASALGIIGEYGEPQSALFRILIDEFGYGSHGKKHSVLYRATMRSFGLDDAYNGYWPWFDTEALALHNAIHWLFQNPRNFFAQMGFLLYAETAYQRSTQAHHRYLRQFHPEADARYFGEHAHIDLHHTRMVIEEAVTPLAARFGAEVGREIVAGAEFTRTAFARAGEHLVAVSEAFAASGSAAYGPPLEPRERLGRPVTPRSDLAGLDGARIQVGALGWLDDARDFATFPPGAIGRVRP